MFVGGCGQGLAAPLIYLAGLSATHLLAKGYGLAYAPLYKVYIGFILHPRFVTLGKHAACTLPLVPSTPS